MALVAAVVILVFGNVRRGVGAVLIQESLFEGFLGEFCMFDMLLVSLKYCKDNAVGLFWGFNYLSIFTVPIPGVDIQQFDHMFTGILFKERFRGGIPTSLFGSLYFNFSYIGVCLGTVLFGTLLSFIQRKLQLLSNYASIGYYSIFATFVYDLIRVGDIGREAWSLITFLLIYVVFQFFMNKVAKDR